MTRYLSKYPAFTRCRRVCRYRVSFFFCIILMLLLTFNADGQKAYLSNGKKKIPFKEHDWIGLTTINDTIKYWGDKEYSYYIVSTGSDSLVVRRPGTFLDTIVLEDDIYERRLPFDYRQGKCYKGENKVRYCRIRKVLSYDVTTFAYKDLTTITYRVYTGRMDGCAGCILIPGLNIWWFINVMKRQEKKLDMQKWMVLVE